MANATPKSRTAGTDLAPALAPNSSGPPERVRRIGELPREVGVLFVVAGIGGILLPGPVGTPFLILGSFILWPRALRRVEESVLRRFPSLHRHSVRHVERFIEDLNRRYPPEDALATNPCE